MEFNVLNFLKFEMGNPTIKIFLRQDNFTFLHAFCVLFVYLFLICNFLLRYLMYPFPLLNTQDLSNEGKSIECKTRVEKLSMPFFLPPVILFSA